MADTSSLHGIGFTGVGPCPGGRYQSCNSDVSLCGLHPGGREPAGVCRRFGISAEIGYKWLKRWESGDEGLQDRSRRPHQSPLRCLAEMEARVLEVRDEHPVWGARKIRECLRRTGIKPPAISTVHAILSRYGRVDHVAASTAEPGVGLRKMLPNLLWQMDFKGWVRLGIGVQCHPLTMIDDHSRYVPCLKACADQRTETVQAHLVSTFRRHGLPEAMFVDNGSPWGDFRVWPLDATGRLARKTGHYSDPQPAIPSAEPRQERTLSPHPEGGGFCLRDLQGFPSGTARLRSLVRSTISSGPMKRSVKMCRPAAIGQARAPCPRVFPRWNMKSMRSCAPFHPQRLISFKGRFWKVPQAFRGERVAIRPLNVEGAYGVFFASYQIAKIDLRQPPSNASKV